MIFGNGKSEFVSRKLVMLEAAVASQVRLGDEFQAGVVATLGSTSSAALTASCQVVSGGLQLSTQATQQVSWALRCPAASARWHVVPP